MLILACYCMRMSLTRRTQILLDEDRHERLRRRADERGTSVAKLIREAIDRAYPPPNADRAAAAQRLLDAPPMPVDDWPKMKREMLDGMWSGGVD